MPSTTPQGVPYPLGTDRVADGDNVIQSLATWVDSAFCSGSAYTTDTGPGVGGTMWFNSSPYALHGGCAVGGTFPLTGIMVPRKGWYHVQAVGAIRASTAGNVGRLFIGDGTNVWCEGTMPISLANWDHVVTCMTVVQLPAGTVVKWGLTSNGSQAVGIYGNANKNSLHVRLLVPLP